MILVTLIWSSNGLLIKLVAWSPMSISGLRSLFPALVLLPFLGKPRHLVSFDTLMGGLGFAGALTTFVIATKLTTAANAIFLQLTAPVYVALLSGWLLGERVRVLDWVITGIILSGMLLFFLATTLQLTVSGEIYAPLSVPYAGLFLFFFRVGVLAYNAGKLFLRNTLDRSWSRYQAQTLRWRFYQTAGKIVYHAGSVWLKIRREMAGLFSRVRYRNWEFANG